MLDIQKRGQTQIIKSTLCYAPKRLEIDEDGEDDKIKIQKNEHGNTQTRANHMALSCPLVNYAVVFVRQTFVVERIYRQRSRGTSTWSQTRKTNPVPATHHITSPHS